ncbi:MAG: hypothetical protein LBN74_08990 [Prevotella sp.]|jgi:hypothetical protein|nr:hypothetical protein [Prevotella sp.]
MLLFNTNRSNKGKKYFKKNEGVRDFVYAEKAEAFNRWFEQNNRSVIEYLSARNFFDSDIFNDSYLKMYENILYSGNDVDYYRFYFVRSYFTNLMADRISRNRYCEFLPCHEQSDADILSFAESEANVRKLEKDILNFVYVNYNIRDFELFKMYISLKPAVNYASLAKITGLKAHNIQRSISKIRKSVRANNEFMKRRGKLI